MPQVQRPYLRQRHSESGMVTSELAIGLIPISVLVLAIFVVTSAMASYLQAQDMSRIVARQVSVGMSVEDAVKEAEEKLIGSHVAVERDGDVVTAVVSIPSAYGKFPVSAHSSAIFEGRW
ncbi:hypothetical protein I6E29_08380 [Arcanobacterium haemolyticum]|nr:hypothetical protein [Arcanobacterium haemolyticum]